LRNFKKNLTIQTNLRRKEKERRGILTAQFNSYKENIAPKSSPLDRALNNSVTIDAINDIRHLISSKTLDPIFDDEDKLSTIQKIASGMLEGVIPLSNPQNLAFTDQQKTFMKELENMELDEVSEHIKDNIDDFNEVFHILDLSLKLLIKAFDKYGSEGV